MDVKSTIYLTMFLNAPGLVKFNEVLIIEEMLNSFLID